MTFALGPKEGEFAMQKRDKMIEQHNKIHKNA